MNIVSLWAMVNVHSCLYLQSLATLPRVRLWLEKVATLHNGRLGHALNNIIKGKQLYYSFSLLHKN